MVLIKLNVDSQSKTCTSLGLLLLLSWHYGDNLFIHLLIVVLFIRQVGVCSLRRYGGKEDTSLKNVPCTFKAR